MELFEARNLLYERIKRLPGFVGLNINAKTGIGGTLCVYVTNKEAKESLHKTIGDIPYGYYIEYIITEGLKFS